MSKVNWPKLALACTLLVACASPAASQDRLIVALYVGGDVGQTQRLAVAIEHRIRSSSQYRLALAEDRVGVAVSVVDNVIPMVVGGIDYMRYQVVFERADGTALGRSAGRCQDRRTDDCASRIMADLERALRSHRRSNYGDRLPNPTGVCRGEFRFDRIPSEPLRDDALHTIVQFAALDETVAVVDPLPTGPGPLTIAGRGSHCDEFGRSFLASEMAEFQGLSYRRVQ